MLGDLRDFIHEGEVLCLIIFCCYLGTLIMMVLVVVHCNDYDDENEYEDEDYLSFCLHYRRHHYLYHHRSVRIYVISSGAVPTARQARCRTPGIATLCSISVTTIPQALRPR